MEIIRLSNSFIAYIQYDSEEKILYLTLSTAKQHKYTGVPAGVWNELKSSKNKGNFVTNRIVHNRKYHSEYIGEVPSQIFNQKRTNSYKFLAR